MSTGNETAVSAGTWSLGTNSSRGSLPGAGVGGGEGDSLGGAAWGAAAASLSGPGPARPSRARPASDTRTMDFMSSLLPLLHLRRRRVAGDPESHVRPRLGPVVAVAEAQLGHRAVQVARAHDDVQLAFRRAGGVTGRGGLRGGDGIDVVPPLRDVAPQVE